MTILRVIAAGIFGGIVLFIIPFLLIKLLFFVLFAGLLFRIVGGRWNRRRWYLNHHDHGRYHFHESAPGKEGLSDPFYSSPKQV